MTTKRRLGRGLDALLEPGRRGNAEPGDEAAGTPPGAQSARDMHVDMLRPGRYQPRRAVAEEGLGELADSIRQQGVLQPLVVRAAAAANPDGAAFEIVAGERRWRAARLAGLATVPVVVRELDDQSALAVALIENLQREDLNPIDQAYSLSRLAGEFNLTHAEVAQAVGRSRASVSNLLRLLDLHDEAKDLLASGAIDMGHARAMLSLDARRQASMARKVQRRGLSVRQVEQAVRGMLAAGEPEDREAAVDLQTRWLQRQLSDELGRKVSLRPAPGGGYSLHVGFGDLAQLEEALLRIQDLIGRVRATAGPRTRDAR